MSETNKSGLSQNALSTGMGKAIEAAAKVFGNVAMQGVDAAANAKTGFTWLDEWIEPYREQLGGLSFMLPKFLERANPSAETENTYVLLFRGSPKGDSLVEEHLWRVIQALVHGGRTFQVSRQLRVKLDELQGRGRNGVDPAQYGLRTDQLFKYFGDDAKRRELPELLDELKHEVRADRIAGLKLVHERLSWLCNEEEAKDALIWFDVLSEILGPSSLRELLCNDSYMDALAQAIALPASSKDWEQPILDAFGELGIDLTGDSQGPPELSLCVQEYVLNEDQGKRQSFPQFILFDHKRDRCFYIRTVKGSLEVFSPTYGTKFNCAVHETKESRTAKYAIRLPMRVFDARMGMAVWNVDHRTLQEELDGIQLGLQVKFRAWDIGALQTPLALFVIHYRDGDLGEYYEMGVGCFVYPQKDPAAVGMYVMGDQLAVSTELAAEGGKIWGYKKSYESKEAWDVYLQDRSSAWKLTSTHGATNPWTVEFKLPRGGHRASPKVPLLSYTMNHGHWHRSLLTRQGVGESLRLGGNGVSLRVCRNATGGGNIETPPDSIPFFLRKYSIIDERGEMRKRPNYSLWTEHMSAELGSPQLLRVFAQEQD